MKKRRTPIEIFSLSFLDIISCAFGAVVMLILLANNGDGNGHENGESASTDTISKLIQVTSQKEARITTLQQELSHQRDELIERRALARQHSTTNSSIKTQQASKENDLRILAQKTTALKQTQSELTQASLSIGNNSFRDAEVGGIPVDSEYVIFIVDTSGSMKQIWPKVINTLEEVLNNHPKIKGFQVLSDNGHYLISASKGAWRSDSPRQRELILKRMRNWYGASNSSPLEGIQIALKAYAQKHGSLALYVFGDDYTGGSYDQALNIVNQLNTSKTSGKKIARIHGVGFISTNIPSIKYATLMREVARQNNGTFMTVH